MINLLTFREGRGLHAVTQHSDFAMSRRLNQCNLSAHAVEHDTREFRPGFAGDNRWGHSPDA